MKAKQGFYRFAREASEIGARLLEAGLTFSYHNHSFEFARYGKRTGLDIIYQESDPRYLRPKLIRTGSSTAGPTRLPGSA